MVVARCGREGWQLLNEHGVSVWEEERSSGDWLRNNANVLPTLLSCTLKMVTTVHFMCVHFTTIKKHLNHIKFVLRPPLCLTLSRTSGTNNI